MQLGVMQCGPSGMVELERYANYKRFTASDARCAGLGPVRSGTGGGSRPGAGRLGGALADRALRRWLVAHASGPSSCQVRPRPSVCLNCPR